MLKNTLTEQNIVTKRFLEFLKENNALKKYRKNIIKLKKCHCHNWAIYFSPFALQSLKYTISQRLYSELISLSFLWAATNEKSAYWLELDRKWRIIVNEEIENGIKNDI